MAIDILYYYVCIDLFASNHSFYFIVKIKNEFGCLKYKNKQVNL